MGNSAIITLASPKVDSLQTFIGEFNRDVSAATASVAYTGVGFEPKAVLFFASIVGVVGQTSWGFDDLTNTRVLVDNASNTVDTYNQNATRSIQIAITGGGVHTGTISVFGADGFTIDWIKSGSPTGTATIYYMAIG